LIPNYKPGPTLRLYPAGVEIEDETDDRNVVVREDWRFVWDVRREKSSDLPGQTVSAYDCLAWEAVDWVYYGSEAVDRIVFVKDPRTSEVLWVEVPFLRAKGSLVGNVCGGDEPDEEEAEPIEGED